MQRWTNFTLRALFIIGFLIVLPVMAMPSVAGFLDRLLYGQPESSVPPVKEPESHAPRKPSEPAQADATRATLEVPLPPESSSLPEESAPPPLQRAPDFLQRAESAESKDNAALPASDVGPLDQATAREIDAVRSRLEVLGAEYVRLEMSEDGRTFHCLCDMLVENSGGKTQPFEATRKDPVAAAAAVLANVEAWRKAERSPARASKSGPSVRTR